MEHLEKDCFEIIPLEGRQGQILLTIVYSINSKIMFYYAFGKTG